MGSRRSRPTNAAADELLGKRHEDLSIAGAGPAAGAAGRHYRLLFERAPLPYVVTDFDGTIRTAHDAGPARWISGRRCAARERPRRPVGGAGRDLLDREAAEGQLVSVPA